MSETKDTIHFKNTVSVQSVAKRDGVLAPFDATKIYDAILKAGLATGELSEKQASNVTEKVLLEIALGDEKTVMSIEDIQDIVEKILIKDNYFKTAKAYILYREKRAWMRQNKKTMVDVESSINEYLQKLDWRVNANANQGYSNGGLILNVSGKVTANYWLSTVYTSEVGEAHRNGDIHIHDLDMLAANCAGWSLKTLLKEG
ncbi:MAG: ribonucleoside triphosphate reductase, partial [Alphaproteobacteria bacterium]|nr:ribonucleoside triphosphate reductase [Alphaproteobacteria bacterium]